MYKFDEAKACEAIREAMEETVAHLGVSYVRSLSLFPSSNKLACKKAA